MHPKGLPVATRENQDLVLETREKADLRPSGEIVPSIAVDVPKEVRRPAEPHHVLDALAVPEDFLRRHVGAE
jgi:hypothetical protein